MPKGDWARGDKYFIKHPTGATISWDDSKAYVLLWVDKKSYRFPNATIAIKAFDKLKKRPHDQTVEEWLADYEAALQENSDE